MYQLRAFAFLNKKAKPNTIHKKLNGLSHKIKCCVNVSMPKSKLRKWIETVLIQTATIASNRMEYVFILFTKCSSFLPSYHYLLVQQMLHPSYIDVCRCVRFLRNLNFLYYHTSSLNRNKKFYIWIQKINATRRTKPQFHHIFSLNAQFSLTRIVSHTSHRPYVTACMHIKAAWCLCKTPWFWCYARIYTFSTSCTGFLQFQCFSLYKHAALTTIRTRRTEKGRLCIWKHLNFKETVAIRSR